MKYIDAEKLKAEIERQLERYDPHYTSAGFELTKLLSFVNSLQQEQSVDLDEIAGKWVTETASGTADEMEFLMGIFKKGLEVGYELGKKGGSK